MILFLLQTSRWSESCEKQQKIERQNDRETESQKVRKKLQKMKRTFLNEKQMTLEW
jgi:hypothetical protein